MIASKTSYYSIMSREGIGMTKIRFGSHKWLEFTIFFVVFLVAINVLPIAGAWHGASDWRRFFRPAAQNVLSPYLSGIFNPPWLFALLAPLAWPPAEVGFAALAAFTMCVLIGYEEDWYKALAVVLSAPALGTISLGQIDVLPLVGLIGPVWCSLPLLAVKPQGAFLVALRRLTPTSIACLLAVLALSFLVWGGWPLEIMGGILAAPQMAHNITLFPWGLAGAAGILIWLARHRDSQHADALLGLASLMASPFWGLHSALPAVALVIKRVESKWGCLAICLVTWAYGWAWASHV